MALPQQPQRQAASDITVVLAVTEEAVMVGGLAKRAIPVPAELPSMHQVVQPVRPSMA
jgi:hypothetical protein